MDAWKSVIKFETPLSPNYYNAFFNPNICHVCKIPNDRNFISCEKCYMIVYCSLEHKQLHNPQHMQICKVIQNIVKMDAEWYTRRSNLVDWTQSKNILKQTVKEELSRELEVYEMLMIMFAKSCLICHQQTNLYVCLKCYSANYCIDHAETFKINHSSNCEELLLYLNLAISYLNHNMIHVMKFLTFPDIKRPVVNMNTFIKQYVRQFKTKQLFHSDYVSGPLTLYYGLRDLNLLHVLELQVPICVVYIIAPDKFDRAFWPAWELLLHLLYKCSIKTLQIVIIEPEETKLNISLCSECKQHNAVLILKSSRMLYHNDTGRSNVIMGFQADLSDEETWSKLISALLKPNCTLLLTATSQLKASQNMYQMQNVLGTSLSLLYHGENKFSSQAPYRDIEIEGVFYRNKYLTIYSNVI